VTDIFEEFDDTRYLLLLNGKVKVFAELRHNVVLDALKLTAQNHVCPDLRFFIAHILINRSS
jgi:hypothetical protein